MTSYSSHTKQTARKEYECDWCGGEILPGDDYAKMKWTNRGRYGFFRLCNDHEDDCNDQYLCALADLGRLSDTGDQDPQIVKGDHENLLIEIQNREEAGIDVFQ